MMMKNTTKKIFAEALNISVNKHLNKCKNIRLFGDKTPQNQTKPNTDIYIYIQGIDHG